MNGDRGLCFVFMVMFYSVSEFARGRQHMNRTGSGHGLAATRSGRGEGQPAPWKTTDSHTLIQAGNIITGQYFCIQCAVVIEVKTMQVEN